MLGRRHRRRVAATTLAGMMLAMASQPVDAASAASAEALNVRGYRMYRARKFGPALEAFNAAIAADAKFALAHYNRAATLGLLRSADKVCEFEAYRSTIVEALRRSVELDPKRAHRMKTDADFVSVRDTVGYQKLLGKTFEKDAADILQTVSWYGPGVGVWGSLLSLDFQAGRQVTVVRKKPTEDGKLVASSITGTWTTDGKTVHLELGKPFEGKTRFVGRIDEKGALEFEAPLGRLTDEPSECDA